MNDIFYYLGYREQEIENEKWIKIFILSNEKLVIVPIYKHKSKDLIENLENLTCFDDVSSMISFGVKSNGKVTLDINF